MRLGSHLIIGIGMVLATAALAETSPHAAKKPASTATPAKPMEVSADQSLEWYQDKRLYVARGNAKAVRDDMVVEADVLTAHEREKPQDAKSAKTAKATTPPQPEVQADKNDINLPAPPSDTAASAKPPGNEGSGDIDKMTAEGNVRITTSTQRVLGQHAVYDMANHTMVVTGDNLRYETEKEIVTAKDALEYYEDKKIAVARGHAIADEPGRHVEGEILTAEFRDTPDGANQLTKMTAIKNVTIITKTDVARGDHSVYDAARDIAIITGHVRITRADGTQLTGDVGEVDFKTNQSRLLNSGHGRVRALLPPKTAKGSDKTAASETE